MDDVIILQSCRIFVGADPEDCPGDRVTPRACMPNCESHGGRMVVSKCVSLASVQGSCWCNGCGPDVHPLRSA